jgi:nitrogen regulatory protein P-II 1
MRLVIAILRPAQVESVRQALAAVEVTRMTIGDAQGFQASDSYGMGRTVQEAVIEVACNDDFIDRTTGAIAAVLAAAGDDTAGRLFTLPIVEAVQLYRDVRGPEAV